MFSFDDDASAATVEPVHATIRIATCACQNLRVTCAGGRAAAFDPGGHSPSPKERAAAAEMLRMIRGIHKSQAVHVVAELGIADLLARGPMSAALPAQATRTHGPSLYRVLRFLSSLGVFNQQPDGPFGLTVIGDLRGCAAMS